MIGLLLTVGVFGLDGLGAGSALRSACRGGWVLEDLGGRSVAALPLDGAVLGGWYDGLG